MTAVAEPVAPTVASGAEELTESEILRVENLRVHLRTDHGLVRAVEGTSLSVPAGRSLGIVGESGCGKSQAALAIMGLLPPRIGFFAGGHIWYRKSSGETVDITKLDPRGEAIRNLRGNEIAIVFQEPMTSLNPVYTIGEQIVEAIRLHQKVDYATARKRAIEMLERVEIPAAAERFSDYPHQLSGGMRQRVMIAMALSGNPRLLIADEPTTALDVTIQAQILSLIKQLQRDFGMSLILITHDLGVVREVVETVAVMYLGKIVEQGPVARTLSSPLHPYTRSLIATIPKIGRKEKLLPIRGTVPSAMSERRGCDFAPRCDFAMTECRDQAPPMFAPNDEQTARCWLHRPGTAA